MKDNEIHTRDLLNAQTGRLAWAELARHFARGVVVCVAPGQDLVEIAERLVTNDADTVERLYESGFLRRALDEDAMHWQQHDQEFWAVVVAPGVLVQELAPQNEKAD